jgi:hypothetical protein
MWDDEFNAQRAKILRDLAEQADPFIKRRLLKLMERYEPSRRTAPTDRERAEPLSLAKPEPRSIR